jgi:dTDP-glucose 4,6-dehydratase
VPITEEHPLFGQSPYSATKIAADQIAMSFHYSFKTPVAVIRPFNTYGPRQSARAVIPTIISQIAAGGRAIRLGALAPTRDFNYISDTVRGFVNVLENEKSVGEVINIGSGHEISIGDTVAVIAKLMNAEVEIARDPERLRPDTSEVERLLASNAKAKKLVAWTPEYAGREGFERGLKKTIDWYRNPENLKAYKVDRYNI